MANAIALLCSAIDRRAIITIGKPIVFALLLWAASAAGAVPIPGTPVPITLQTFVVMVAALAMSWRQTAAAIALYLAAGAVGLPVFAGGTSTAAFFGPSAGFLIGFLPAAIVTAWLKGDARRIAEENAKSDKGFAVRAALRFARYFAACIAGCIVLDYVLGIGVQSIITGVDPFTVTLASTGFIAGDLVKAVIASLTIAGARSLR